MNTNRKIAIIAGVLFIIADVATFTGDALTPALTGTDYLIQLSAHAEPGGCRSACSRSSPPLQVSA